MVLGSNVVVEEGYRDEPQLVVGERFHLRHNKFTFPLIKRTISHNQFVTKVFILCHNIPGTGCSPGSAFDFGL